jgi:hypothetical protein
MVGGAKMLALAGEGKKILMVAVSTFHTGKAYVMIAAVQVPVNDLLQISNQIQLGKIRFYPSFSQSSAALPTFCA